MESKNQKQQILEYLKQGYSIDGLTALNKLQILGGFRARISELREEVRKEGYVLKDKFIKLESGKQIKTYWLENIPGQIKIF